MSVAETPSPRKSTLHQPLQVVEIAGALLTIRTVEALTGLKKSSIYDRIARGQFPAPVRLSQRCSRWKSQEVAAFLAAAA